MNPKIELLSPVGDFECLVAAVQNGADAVYFGADKFNARINGINFSNEELKKAITYAKLRNVKTYLTLNILIKNDEFKEAIELVEYAYECGIDALIVQDLGLARFIIKNYPDLEVHASTQMTVHNVEGVKELKKLGFKRVVLSRELNLDEIKDIYNQTKEDLEVFVHGALCISYSGQCLMSSIIGQRSGNRGKCAGTCRLPYELINKKENKIVDKGYLLSSKDVCTLDILPELLKTGVMSLKIEGRMKTPEYVGVVTSIYRKYIDLALSKDKYIVDENDKKELMQVFNRGGFSTGYLKGKLGKNMMYTKRPNHIGIVLGIVISYNLNKGYVKIKLKENMELGDSIKINESSCKSSELMKNNNNIKTAKTGEIVTIGRIKGNIKAGDIVYKTVSVSLENKINQTLTKDVRKRKVFCKVEIETGKEAKIDILDLQTQISSNVIGNIVEKGQTQVANEERIKAQINKMGGTVFELESMVVNLSKDAYISIKELNELRRKALGELEQKILQKIYRDKKNVKLEKFNLEEKEHSEVSTAVLLNTINPNYNYKALRKIDRIYLPISELILAKNLNKLEEITNNLETYIYMPNIIRDEHIKIIYGKIEELLKKYKIQGFVVSNLSQIKELQKYNLSLIGNYTLNVFNDETAKELENLRISTITISPELNEEEIRSIKTDMKKEFIVYGRLPLMTSEYCTIGTFKNCAGTCTKGEYALKDRMNFEFPIKTNRINCNTTIYNSKITSIMWKNLNLDSIRIDILDETIEEINKIVEIHKQNKRLEGQNYTNGNLKKNI